MKPFFLFITLAPALAAAQLYVVDRVPTPATEVTPLYNVGTTATTRAVIERFTIDREIQIDHVILYGQLPENVSITFHSAAAASFDDALFGWGVPTVDLGPVAGTSFETRRYRADGNVFFGALAPGTYWLKVSFQSEATLARVSAVDDGLVRTASNSGANQFVQTGGDLAVSFGIVPEPASLAALGLGLAAWRRRFGRRTR